ncbi:integrase catalytic domain-containing protein, partial [Trichonephila clavipes]
MIFCVECQCPSSFDDLHRKCTQILEDASMDLRKWRTNSSELNQRWKLIQLLRDKFWNRWSTEYLTHLQTVQSGSVQNPNLMENQLVLLKDPNTSPWDWPMERILEVLPGSDGLVRVVNVKPQQ